MKILVKLPTKKRKDKFFSVLDKFIELSNNLDNIHYVITLDNDDAIMNTSEVKEKFRTYKNLSYVYGDSKSKLDATNRDLDLFKNWDILVLASDDTIPLVKGWDTIIIDKMMEHFPDTDGALHFNDGHQRENLNTMPILGKKYFDRFGYVQYPGYKSVYADVDFMDIAKILNKIVYFEDVIIEHQHPDWGYGTHDYAHTENYQNLHHDKNLYEYRKSINFGLK